MESVRLIVFSLLAACAATAGAEEIVVAPGEGTLAAAAEQAGGGGVLALQAGRYLGSVQLPGGVMLRGAGCDQSILVPDDPVAINCLGPGIIISGITIEGTESTRRGINTQYSVRIERCRFVGIPEAVALMGAPLSDIIACTFEDCRIGVRAIADASPTVWGCRFEGGTMGIFAMGGAPYIQSNLFRGTETAVRLLIGDGSGFPIVRANTFDRPKIGIEASARDRAIFGPSIRNNVFIGAPIVIAESIARSVSHNVVHDVEGSPVRDEGGRAVIDPEEHRIIDADPGLVVTDSGEIRFERRQVLHGAGIGDRRDAPPADIGPDEAWSMPGCGAPAGTQLPPVRFGEAKIANSVAEQYQFLQMQRLRLVEQGLTHRNETPFDIMTVRDAAGEEQTLEFDISRFFHERGL